MSSFQNAAQNILGSSPHRTSSPRFPPRNHEDLVQAREYEDLLDTFDADMVRLLLFSFKTCCD
mgnify:FL=1